jgi:hypothetical protein
MKTLSLILASLSLAGSLWSAEPLYRVTVNGKIGFIRSDGTVAIQPTYDRGTSKFRDGFATAVKGTQFGILGANGEFKPTAKNLQPQGEFVNGVSAAIQWSQTPGGDRYGLMNESGVLVVPCSYEALTDLQEGFWAVRKQNGGKYGIIKADGSVATGFQYDVVGKFKNGLAPASVARKWGYIDSSGAQVIPAQYLQAREFSDGRAVVTSTDGQFVIDERGAKLFDVQDEQFWTYREGMAAIKKEGKMGFRDLSGKIVIPCDYDQVGDFSEGLAAARQNMKWGYIDKTGKMVIPPTIPVPTRLQNQPAGMRIVPPAFLDGLAMVEVDEGTGYIDKKGAWVWKPTK